MIIEIEGIDQAGKSTQCQYLERQFRAKGFDVYLYKFPAYHTETGGLLSKALAGDIYLPAEALYALFSANRYEVDPRIRAVAEKAENIILIDRYIFSGVAYGMARGLDKSWLFSLDSKLSLPDLVLILRVDADLSVSRISERHKDTYEKDTNFLRKVSKIYDDLSVEFNDIFTIVDSNRTIQEVSYSCWDNICKMVQKRKAFQ